MSKAAQTAKIIVSYRRSDSAMAGRIFDRLVQRFGKKSLFIDIDNIPFGGDFRKHVHDALKSSDLLIALVGSKWAGGEGKDAKIAREADPVRVEIETALRQEIPILPVLLDEARMPDPSELPESLREFAYRNAAEVESGRDFDIHVDRLIKAVEQILGAETAQEAQAAIESATKSPSPLVSPAPATPPPTTKRFPMPLLLGGALLALAGLAAAVWFARDRLLTAEDIDPTTGTAYCNDYKQVIDAARADFVPILGRPNGDAIWISRTQLPGWDNCIVADWTNEGKIIRYFGCELPPVATVDELHAKRDTAAAYMQSCLGRDWARKRVTYQSGATETNFTLGSDEPVGRIRESIYTDSRGNILRLEADVPAQLIRAAPAGSVSGSQQPSDQAGAYCDDLKRAVSAAPTNFAGILGPVVRDGVWVARVQLPGWDECTVRDWTSQGKKMRYFTCVRGPFESLEALRAKREEADVHVKPCLGSDWSLRRPGFSHNTLHSIYFMGPNDPEVRLREVFAEDSKQWLLAIDVDAPSTLATPVQPEPADQQIEVEKPDEPAPPEPAPGAADQPLTTPAPSTIVPDAGNAPMTPPPSAY